MKEIHRLLNLRADVKIDVINRLLIKLTKAERAELRGMGAMMQEQYIAVREAVTRCRDIGHEHREQSEQARRHCSTMCVRKKQHEKLPCHRCCRIYWLDHRCCRVY